MVDFIRIGLQELCERATAEIRGLMVYVLIKLHMVLPVLVLELYQ